MPALAPIRDAKADDAKLEELAELYEGVKFWLDVGHAFYDGKDTIPASVIGVAVRVDKLRGHHVAFVDAEGRVYPA